MSRFSKSLRRVVTWLSPFAVLAIFLVVGWLLMRTLRHISLGQVWQSLRTVSHVEIAFALILTAITYVLLMLHDVVMLHAVDNKQSFKRIALSSFIGHAFGYNLGPLGSAVVRSRIYAGWGLDARQIARILSCSLIAFALSCIALGGAALLIDAQTHVLAAIGFTSQTSYAAGLLLLIGALSYFAVHGLGGGSLKVRSFSKRLPRARFTLVQTAILSTETIIASIVLFAFLSPSVHISYMHLLVIFSVAHILGLISHVPAGLGVFEFAFLSLFPGHHPQVIAAILAYRGIYYLLPLLVATAAFIAYEVRRKRSIIADTLNVLDTPPDWLMFAICLVIYFLVALNLSQLH